MALTRPGATAAAGAPAGRARRSPPWRRVPTPLTLLLVTVLAFATAWAVANPAWQAPDEPQHFGYAESLAERGKRPLRGTPAENALVRQRRGEPVLAGDVAEVTEKALSASNAYPVAFDLYARPPWSELAEDRYEATAQEGSRVDGGRYTGASPYPPLYYALETLPYRAASSGTALDRLYLMRWFSGLWALVTALGAWLLAGEVFGRNRLAQLVTAATLGLWPMILFISAAVNPDAMLTGLSTLVLWLCVRVARRGPDLRSCLGIVALLVAAATTKVSGVALIPAALVAVVLGLEPVRRRVGDRLPRLVGLAGAMAVAAALVLLAAGRSGVLPAHFSDLADQLPNLRRFASYLWQFYLPKLPWMQEQLFHFPVISDLPVYNTWLGTSWGVFSWVDVWFAPWTYRLFLAISLLVLAGGLWWLVTAYRRSRRDPGRTGGLVALVLATAAVAVLAGIHLQDYTNGVDRLLPFAQGRYLFPVAGIGGLVVGAAVLALPRRARPVAAGAWLAFLVVFNVGAFAIQAGRFYA